MPNDEAPTVVDTTGKPIPFVTQLWLQFLVECRREKINELDGINRSVNISIPFLVEVKDVALQFEQRDAERCGRTNAVVHILLNDLEIFQCLRVALGNFQLGCRAKFTVNVIACGVGEADLSTVQNQRQFSPAEHRFRGISASRFDVIAITHKGFNTVSTDAHYYISRPREVA